MRIFFLLLTGLLYLDSAHSQKLETVANVDLTEYAGLWYEIASYPKHFQKGCACTTTEYTPTDEEFIIVENRCFRDALSRKRSYIKGKAFVVKNSGNAKLKIQFFWFFKSKYWIIDLAEDYSYAVISHPNKKYLWILAREPEMDKKTYQQITNRLQEKGFDLSKLQATKQK